MALPNKILAEDSSYAITAADLGFAAGTISAVRIDGPPATGSLTLNGIKVTAAQVVNDNLYGGAGSDTYQFGRGDGADLLQENDATAGNQDTLQLEDNISASQLWLTHVNNDLQVSIIGTADKVTVSNWYLGSQYHVEQIKSGDGKTLLDTDVDKLVQAMAAFIYPPAAGQTTLPANYQAALAPVLAANWH